MAAFEETCNMPQGLKMLNLRVNLDTFYFILPLEGRMGY
jgi:hypothetical protein